MPGTMKIPGPDHMIEIAAAPQRWRVAFNGHVLGETGDALVLTENKHDPVIYFPRADIAMDYFARTERSTYCPYKGDAAYYTVDMDGQIAENAVWTYEEPYPAMERIRERLAFYTDRFEVYAVGEAGDRAAVDEIVRHTDSGSGASQAEHWPANVETPSDPGLR